MIQILKDIYRSQKLFLFGNTISYRINLLFVLHNILRNVGLAFGLVKKNAPNKMIDRRAKQLQQNGFLSVRQPIDAEKRERISERIDDLFKMDEQVVFTNHDGGLLRLKNSLLNVPELAEFVLNDSVKQTIQSYMNGPFEIFSCDAYRTVPNETLSEHFGSLKWHFDNCPSAMLKIMVYLTDTDDTRGALTVLDRQKSVTMKKQGFWNRNDADAFVDDIEQYKVVISGQAGDVQLFSTHYCIHKATLPKTEYRDVAVFLVQPSFVQTQSLSDLDRERLSQNFGYCVNPFSSKPLRYGVE